MERAPLRGPVTPITRRSAFGFARIEFRTDERGVLNSLCLLLSTPAPVSRLTNVDQRSFPLNDTGLRASIEVVDDETHRQWTVFSRNCVPYLTRSALAIDKVGNLVRVKFRPVSYTHLTLPTNREV